MLGRRTREATMKLEIMKQCERYCHLFKFFILCSNILQRFSSLKFEESLFSNTFFSFIFLRKMTVHTAEKGQIIHVAQN